MTTYQIATSFDNSASLADLDPQPASEGLLDAVRIYTISGLVYADGAPVVKLKYTFITPVQLSSLYTQMGLTAARYAKVTLKTNEGEDRTSWVTYNAIIYKPMNPRFRFGFYRDVEFIVKMIEDIT